MRQNQYLSKVYRLFFLQMMAVALVMFAWSFKGPLFAVTALLGGLISVLPNLLWAYRFFSKIHTHSPKQILRSFYLGEIVKMLVSVSLLVMTVCLLQLHLLPLFSGFLVAYLGLWLTPLLARQELQKVMAK